MKPLIGISCCSKQFGVFGMPNHAASDTYVRATDQVVHGVPVLIPASGPAACCETLLDRLDGFVAAAILAAIFGLLRAGVDGAARGLMVW